MMSKEPFPETKGRERSCTSLGPSRVIFAPFMPRPASSRASGRVRRVPLVTRENSKGSPFSADDFWSLCGDGADQVNAQERFAAVEIEGNLSPPGKVLPLDHRHQEIGGLGGHGALPPHPLLEAVAAGEVAVEVQDHDGGETACFSGWPR